MGNSSMGFLAFSQAVEDAQYGIKGVLNNIPQMILGFGGSMGLAGAISLAAVAAVQLYPHLKKLFTSVDAEILKSASKEWTNVFQKGMKAAKATYDNAVNSIKLKNEIAQINQSYERMAALGQDMAAVHRNNIARLQREREIHEQIYAARDRLLKLQGLKNDTTIEREGREREIADLEKELNERKKEQDKLNAQTSEAIGKKKPLLDLNSDEAILREQKALSNLGEELAKVEAEAAKAKKTLEEMAAQGKTTVRAEGSSITTPTPTGPVTTQIPGDVVTNKSIEERKLKDAEKRAAEIKQEIDNANTRNRETKTGRDAEILKLDNKITEFGNQNQNAFNEQKRLEGLIAEKKELLAIENEIAGIKPEQEAYRLEAEMIRARIAGDEAEIARLERKKAIQEEISRLRSLGMTDKGAQIQAAIEVLGTKDMEKAQKLVDALQSKNVQVVMDLIGTKEMQKAQALMDKLKGVGVKDTAAKMVDARAAAEEADKNRKDKPKQAGSSGPPVAGQLGSVARATNIMMGRAANDGLLEENRRQSALLRSIEKNTKPKTVKPETADFVFH
jgi:chromosome segregation ATPase